MGKKNCLYYNSSNCSFLRSYCPTCERFIPHMHALCSVKDPSKSPRHLKCCLVLSSLQILASLTFSKSNICLLKSGRLVGFAWFLFPTSQSGNCRLVERLTEGRTHLFVCFLSGITVLYTQGQKSFIFPSARVKKTCGIYKNQCYLFLQAMHNLAIDIKHCTIHNSINEHEIELKYV